MGKKKGAIQDQFVSHERGMRESIAWRSLPCNARLVLDRLELELMAHGGRDNGKLPCTYTDFEKAGIRRKSIALAIRQCEALGFVETTHKGTQSISSFRNPSRYRLTYIYGREPNPPRTDDWKRIGTQEAATAALKKAASERSERHVQIARRHHRARKADQDLLGLAA
ncbi:hypothetical protein [Bosea sp. UNC402CLCol]|uniref:hypothetical protein n=1 Tax=Bosea sp. UNC402CLCol TaxID=1510531 RepID=UPI00056ED675|nr:hypothetical protein [Bosea sp. UNC402CLCol]